MFEQEVVSEAVAARLTELSAEFVKCVSIGDLAGAITQGELALEIHPHNKKVLQDVGDLYTKLPQPLWGKAEELHLRALAIDETSTYSLKSLAAIASNSNDLDGALGYLKRAELTNPEDPTIKGYISVIEQVMNQ